MSQTLSDTFLRTLHQRTSIREFTQQEVEEEIIEQVLRAAMAAPSSRNVQPWRFYVIRNRALLQRLASELPFARMLDHAPMAIVVAGDISMGNPTGEQIHNWKLDCSAATQNLLLAAHALGLGAVWTGVYPYEQRIATVRTLLKLPDHIIPLNVIPIGYPAQQPAPKEKWDPAKVEFRD